MEVTGKSRALAWKVSAMFVSLRIGITNRQGVDHGLEAHVDLAAADDLGDIGGVIGLEQGNLQTFIFEVASALGEVEGGVVRGGVPVDRYLADDLTLEQWVPIARTVTVSIPVGQEGNLVGRHDGFSSWNCFLESVCPKQASDHPSVSRNTCKCKYIHMLHACTQGTYTHPRQQLEVRYKTQAGE
jgi:hypothetical protein